MNAPTLAPARPARRSRPLRRLLRWAAALVTAVLLGWVGILGTVWTTAATSNVGEVAFEAPLRIPPLAESTIDAQGRRHFDLRIQAGRTELLPGLTSETWGVNGSYLGPTLRMNRGETVAVDVHNDLPEQTSLHWHGMELPAAADGGPHTPVAPGTTWSPSWRVDQPAATLWYHPHLHGSTAEHVYRGLAGMLLVDDPAADALALPKRYGVDDIPVIVQDKNIDADGELDDSDTSAVGLLGEEILVNGTHGPYLDVTTELVRLRVLNGSNARIYDLGFPDDREFALVGTDAGLLDAPAPLNRLRLSPGDRAEIVVAVRPGETTILRSFPPDLETNFLSARFNGGGDTFDLLELRAADRLESAPPLPARLASAPPIEAPPGAQVRDFELSGVSMINRRELDPARIDAVVLVGRTEIWQVRNLGTPHSFHVHNAAFRVLDVDGEPPPPDLRGRQDTVFLPEGALVRLAVEFGPYPDPTVPFMFHCHLLDHEDRGMMGQFVVVRPDQVDQVRAPDHGRSH